MLNKVRLDIENNSIAFKYLKWKLSIVEIVKEKGERKENEI